jgi:hypothetical protein
MTLTRGAEAGVAGRGPTRQRAIGVAPITRAADRKDAVAASADFLAKRRVHDVEAVARFDWTRLGNRGTTERTGSVRRSIEAVIEGLEVSAPGPHLSRRRRSLRERGPPAKSAQTMDAAGAVDAQTAPTAPWKTRTDRGFPTSVHSHSSVC